MKYILGVCALGFMILPSSTSAALLLGENISVEYRMPNLSTPYGQTTYGPQSFVVGAGQESTVTIEDVTSFNVDFTDTALLIAFDTVLSAPSLQPQSFNGLVFTSSAFDQIATIAIDGSSNLAGFDAGRVSVVGQELRLNMSGLSYNTDTVLGLNFTGRVSAIPEPETWAMMVLGCAFMGGALRASRRRQLARVAFL